MRLLPDAIALLTLFASLAVPASACSVVEGYHIPTNIELIDKADLVVLAEVVGGPDTLDDIDPEKVFEPLVVLKPIRAIKGEAPSELKVWGYFELKGQRFPAAPTALDTPHPTTMMGACVRQGYTMNTL